MKANNWKTLSYEEKELEILRDSVDKMEKTAEKLVQSDEVKRIISIEVFLSEKN